MNAPIVVEGGCQCGAVRYACTHAPLALYVCHCTECRRQSSSAFGISVAVSAEAFAAVVGTPRQWTRPTASGGLLDCAFCGDCGSRLWHRPRDGATLNIKGGTLDAAPDLSGAIHIWTRSRLPGVVIPDSAVQFACEPA